jgi:hypothetical protein
LKTAARKGRGFDSLSLRIWSRGSAARAAALQADNRWFESTRDYWKKGGRMKAEGGRPKNTRSSLPPSSLHLPPSSALVVQPGVDACLSRRRSWVQIPSRALYGKVRKQAKRRSSNLRDVVGSTPTLATWIRDVFPAADCKSAVIKQAGWRRGGSIPSRLTDDAL